MFDPSNPICRLVRDDGRYAFEAYVFVFEALRYAHDELGLGSERPSEEPAVAEEAGEAGGRSGARAAQAPRHLTGQELCEAIRLFALQQYGYMAKCVLNQWGITCTGDFGEIVFNLIRIGEMHKTDDDNREDFDDVFDFEEGLSGKFKIELPQE